MVVPLEDQTSWEFLWFQFHITGDLHVRRGFNRRRNLPVMSAKLVRIPSLTASERTVSDCVWRLTADGVSVLSCSCLLTSLFRSET